jgi:hypothetical protein
LRVFDVFFKVLQKTEMVALLFERELFSLWKLLFARFSKLPKCVLVSDTATGQLLSATVQGPNGTLSSAALAQFASISSIPQSLLSMFTTPSLYHVDPFMGGGTQGIYYGELAISPPSPVRSRGGRTSRLRRTSH